MNKYVSIIKNNVEMYAVFEDFEDGPGMVQELIKTPVLYIAITEGGGVTPLIADRFAGLVCPENISNFLEYEFPTIEKVYSDYE